VHLVRCGKAFYIGDFDQMVQISAAHKLDYIQNDCSSPLVARMVGVFRKAVSHLPASSVPEGIWKALEIDLVYCICRHRSWINSPLLDSICTEFLVTDYRLNRDNAEQIVGELMHAAREIQGSSATIKDREFLRYIFVLASQSQNEEKLSEDLGIGYDLIRKLKAATEHILTDKNSEIVTFLPEVDSLFSEIILDISREIKSNPWSLSADYLRYELDSLPVSLEMIFEDDGFGRVFEFLLLLSSVESISFDSLLKKSNEIAEKNKWSTIDVCELRELLTLLEHKGFIFKSGNGVKGPIYQASDKSQSLTAEAFASKYKKAPTTENLKRLNKYFQIALVSTMTGNRAHMGLELLKSNPYPLNPVTITPLVEVLNNDIDQVRLTELLLKHAASPQPWLRKSVCSALLKLDRVPEATSAVQKFAKEDQSESVRSFALEHLALNLDPLLGANWNRLFAKHEKSRR
jgi:hypothetical protein